MGDVGIWTAVLWGQNRPLYQLSHHNCPQCCLCFVTWKSGGLEKLSHVKTVLEHDEWRQRVDLDREDDVAVIVGEDQRRQRRFLDVGVDDGVENQVERRPEVRVDADGLWQRRAVRREVWKWFSFRCSRLEWCWRDLTNFKRLVIPLLNVKAPLTRLDVYSLGSELVGIGHQVPQMLLALIARISLCWCLLTCFGNILWHYTVTYFTCKWEVYPKSKKR